MANQNQDQNQGGQQNQQPGQGGGQQGGRESEAGPAKSAARPGWSAGQSRSGQSRPGRPAEPEQVTANPWKAPPQGGAFFFA